MNPQQKQGNQGTLSPADIAATLGHVTHLQEGMLPQPEQPQNPQDAPQGTQDAPPDDPRFQQLADAIVQVSGNIEGFKKEVKDDIKKQMDSLRKDIKEALDSDEPKS